MKALPVPRTSPRAPSQLVMLARLATLELTRWRIKVDIRRNVLHLRLDISPIRHVGAAKVGHVAAERVLGLGRGNGSSGGRGGLDVNDGRLGRLREAERTTEEQLHGVEVTVLQRAGGQRESK